MLLSLVDYVNNLRDEFFTFENEAKNLSQFINQDYTDVTKRKIIKKLNDGTVESTSLFGAEKFKVDTFYIIIDKLVTELQSRSDAYNRITELFGFLCNLLNMDDEKVELDAKKLVEVYHDDINNDIVTELSQFISLLKLQPEGFFSNGSPGTSDRVLCPIKILNWITDLKMINTFPNIYIAYRLLVTMPIANCESERSFSVLKRIKNAYRSTMADERLSSLIRLSIEVDLLRSLDFSDLIKDFADAKSRKKYFR